MRKQGGVRWILKVCKDRARVFEVNTRSQNCVTNNKIYLRFHINLHADRRI